MRVDECDADVCGSMRSRERCGDSGARGIQVDVDAEVLPLSTAGARAGIRVMDEPGVLAHNRRDVHVVIGLAPGDLV